MQPDMNLRKPGVNVAAARLARARSLVSRERKVLIPSLAKVHFLNIDKVIAYTLVDNIGSHRVAEKSGFKRIRICKNDCFYHGKIIDRLLFEIDLRDDQEQSN